jgi:hypothetical protein
MPLKAGRFQIRLNSLLRLESFRSNEVFILSLLCFAWHVIDLLVGGMIKTGLVARKVSPISPRTDLSYLSKE